MLPLLIIYIYIISKGSITPQHIKYNSKSLNVVQSLYFGKLPKYRDCTTSNDFELYIYIHEIIKLLELIYNIYNHSICDHNCNVEMQG